MQRNVGLSDSSLAREEGHYRTENKVAIIIHIPGTAAMSDVFTRSEWNNFNKCGQNTDGCGFVEMSRSESTTKGLSCHAFIFCLVLSKQEHRDFFIKYIHKAFFSIALIHAGWYDGA
jgi:hypothetical protein